MKCLALLFAPLLALGIGCNTAQVTQPAIIDAGPPCATIPPQITCDAGEVTPGACEGQVTVTLDFPDASNVIPAGSFKLGCQATFYVQDPASPTCLLPPSCVCGPPDAGVADDAGEGASDGGVTATPPGVWSCFPAP